MAMIMSVIHGSTMHYFGGRALFLLLGMGMPKLGITYVWLAIGYLQVLSIPCSLALSLRSIISIFCKVFCPLYSLLTSYFRGHMLHLYLPPLDVKRESMASGGLDIIFLHDCMPSQSMIIAHVCLAGRDNNLLHLDLLLGGDSIYSFELQDIE